MVSRYLRFSCFVATALFILVSPFLSLEAKPRHRLSFPWLQQKEWIGLAEVAHYAGVVMRYRQRRPADLFLITVTEPFNLQQGVKSEMVGEGAITALKQNQVLHFQTGVYPYRQMNSIFWRVGDGTLIKASMTSQEWCGHTFKEIRTLPKHVQLSYNSYWEGEGVGYYRIPLPRHKAGKVAFLYDELPLILRSPSFSGYKSFSLFPLLMSSQVLRPDLDVGKPARRPRFVPSQVEFSYDSFQLPTVLKKFAKVLKVKIRFRDSVNKNQDVFYILTSHPSRILLGWDRHDGGSFRLKGLYYTDYWNQNANGDTLGKNRIDTLIK